ncbi:9490_t:CDS:2 [Entrophospora sp. SA101]|nr:9490_t:CDS:2 [Entrophospora sp. SA101]
MRLNARVRQSDDDLRLMTIAYYNEKNVRRRWYFSYKDKHRRVGELLREKLFYRKLFQINRDDRRVLKFKLDTLKKAENKRLMQKHLSEWDYKTREAKGLTIKIPMPNSPDFSSSFHSDSSDTGSLTGGMRQKFDTIHRHSRRTSDILGDIEEELHSSDNENSGNSSSSIIIEGTSNTDIPPLFNDSNSSSSDDSEIRSSSSDDDIHARCRQTHIQNIRLRRKAEQDLLECRNERGLLEFNRDRIVNELEIAEDDINDQNRIINILNQEIFALQNNNPHINNNRTGMVGYELKKFHGSPTEDPEEHIEEFRLWLVGSGIDVGAGHANRINAHGVFIASLKGDAKDWYERTIHGKNWELRNLLDNTAQANLAAVQGRNAGQIGVQALNRANGQNGNVVIPAHTVFDEDWSFADGRPTDRLPNAPNTNTGNTVVVPGIRLGQVLYWFKTNYPTVTAEKQRVLFGSTVQGGEPVGRFYSNLRRLARLAGIDERQIRLQFIRGLSPANQIEVRRLGLEKSVDNLLPNLEEIERYTAEQLSGAYLHPISDLTSTKKSVTNYYGNKDNVSVNPGMSKSEIENLIKSMISSSEPQETQVSKKTSPTIPPKNMEEIKAALLLKELYNMGFRDEPIVDFIESYNKRGEYFKRKQAQNDDSDDELANRMNVPIVIEPGIIPVIVLVRRKNLREKLSDSSSEVESMNVNITKSKEKKNEKSTSSDKGQNSGTITVKSNRIDKSLQKIILDMFDGILPVDLMDKLKMKIENSSNIVTPIQEEKNFKSPTRLDFTNYREPIPEIHNAS